MNATSGRTSQPPFAYYDPASASLKTSQITFDLGLTESSPILPRSGSMRNGQLYERPTSVPLTAANAFSSSPGLPTPRASEDEKGGPNQRGSKGDLTLSAVAAQLPTPTATPYGNNQSLSPGAAVQPSLESLAKQLPTPAARDYKGGGQKGQLPTAVTSLPTPTVGDSRGSRNATARRRAPKSTTNTGGYTLSDVTYLMPTPRTSDANGGGQHGAGGLDLRTAVGQLPADSHSEPGKQRRSATPSETAGRRASAVDCGCDRAPWGRYAPAVHQWEQATGQAAPSPVNDRGRLAPVFVEWLMGVRAGHVTGVPGLSRTAQLKALGNGVVPAQGAHAFRILLHRAGIAHWFGMAA